MEKKLKEDCATADCREEVWNIVNKEVAYCCGYSQSILLIAVLIIVIICYMAYIYYTTGKVGNGSILLLAFSILSYFMLPNVMGTAMSNQWTLYNDRVTHLMSINSGMSVTQAKAEISREELQKRTRRAIYNRRRY